MTPRVGYILLEFPRYSETFILNELLALRELGMPARVFCLRGNPEAVPSFPAPFDSITEVVSTSDDDATIRLSDAMAVLNRRAGALRDSLAAAYAKYDRRRESGQGSPESGFLRVAWALRIAAECRRHSIDHVHCHYATLPSEVGILVRKFAGVSCSFTGHAKDIFTLPHEAVRGLLEPMEFAVSCSETGATFLRTAAPEFADRIHCVYHGIRLGEWTIKRKPQVDRPLLLGIGRLTPKKAFHLLVEAVRILRDRGVDVQVELIGDGREREHIQSEIDRHGLADRVRLLGRLSQEEIRRRFEVATALVHPSVVLPSNNQDGLANVVLEAMAAGLPVVVSDVPALREIVQHGDTGLAFRSGDAGDLAESLMKLLRDPGLQDTLSASARRRVSTLDCADAAQKLAGLFRSHE